MSCRPFSGRLIFCVDMYITRPLTRRWPDGAPLARRTLCSSHSVLRGGSRSSTQGTKMGQPTDANQLQPLLVSRQDAALILGNVSVATIIRLEQAGRLTPVRLNPIKTTAQVFYRMHQVAEIASAPVE